MFTNAPRDCHNSGLAKSEEGKEMDLPMTPHTTVLMSYSHDRYLGRPSCPKCGELIMAPEYSEYMNCGGVRHWWSCDGCAYEFETLIEFTF